MKVSERSVQDLRSIIDELRGQAVAEICRGLEATAELFEAGHLRFQRRHELTIGNTLFVDAIDPAAALRSIAQALVKREPDVDPGERTDDYDEWDDYGECGWCGGAGEILACPDDLCRGHGGCLDDQYRAECYVPCSRCRPRAGTDG